MKATAPEVFASNPPSDSATPRNAALHRPSTRFVTQSHALGGPPVRPRALLVATGIAVFVYLLGRRLSG